MTKTTVLPRLIDLTLTAVALALADTVRPVIGIGLPIASDFKLDWPVYLLALTVWAVTFEAFGVYKPAERGGWQHRSRGLPGAALVATVLMAGVLYLTYRDVSRVLFLYFAAFDLIGLVAWRILAASLVERVGAPRRILIVGTGPLAIDLYRSIADSRSDGIVVAGFVGESSSEALPAPLLGPVDDVAALLEQNGIEDIVVAMPAQDYERTLSVALDLQRLHANVWMVPDVRDLCFTQATVESFGGRALLNLRGSSITGLNRTLKRTFDFAVALGFTIVALPAMALIAVAIRLDSPGPALFRQRRVGENCRPFSIFKFRTMVVNADRVAVPADGAHKLRHDPRVTRVGRFLRQTSLDELPQLFNILRGDMSLVGPRPELPQLVNRYDRWQYRRFMVPQGLTGWWQINGRSDRPMHLHTEDDLYYIRNYSILLDLKILLRTIQVVLARRGAF